jgi:hypothetical protein
MSVSKDREDAVLREAAHRLADTIAPYRILTRDRLAELSGVGSWRTVTFEHALQWAVDNDVLRALGGDLYELCEQTAEPQQPITGT